MKERHGFVSNSSSTSFCIYGVYVDDATELLNQLVGEFVPKKIRGCKHPIAIETVKFCPECGKPSWIVEEDNRDITYDLEAKLEEMGFDVCDWCGGEHSNEGMYFGKSLKGNINNAKDPLEILRNIDSKLRKTFPKAEIKFYSDGGYS